MATEAAGAVVEVTHWSDVARELRAKGGEAVIPRGRIAHPRDAGAKLSMGLSTRRGHRADWRFAPEADGSGLHVQEFAKEWRAHVDKVHPAVDAAKHLAADVGPLLRHPLVKQAVVGALLGMAVSGSVRYVLRGLLR